jgi:hypothetical protein
MPLNEASAAKLPLKVFAFDGGLSPMAFRARSNE